MKADTVIRHDGMNALIKSLGLIEAERFIMLIQKEAFDYTKWQENLFEDMTIEEIYANAARLRAERKKDKRETGGAARTSSPGPALS